MQFMKKLKFILLFGLLFHFMNSNLVAQELADEGSAEKAPFMKNFGLAIGLKASTMGPGAEITAQLSPMVQVRLGGTYLNYSILLSQFKEFDEINDDVAGKATFTTGGVSLLANLQLSRIVFLTFGGIYNLTEIDFKGNVLKPMTIGDILVEPENVGSIEIGFKPGMQISPYAGIGFGRTISKNKIVSFATEIGVLYTDSPKTKLITTGMLSPTSSPEQQKQFQDNMAWVYLYPMLNFQLSFRIL